MTITIISPEKFKTIPWKNGLGETTELAINEGGSLSNFDWRLSIATVTEDGVFSDFSDYSRNLVLISGQGIRLKHDGDKVDQLDKLLDMASFDGGCITFGKLTSGTIKDFNIMTKKSTYHAKVDRYINEQSITLETDAQYFVYGLNQMADVYFNDETMTLPSGHLLTISKENKNKVTINGTNLIIIQLIKNI